MPSTPSAAAALPDVAAADAASGEGRRWTDMAGKDDVIYIYIYSITRKKKSKSVSPVKNMIRREIDHSALDVFQSYWHTSRASMSRFWNYQYLGLDFTFICAFRGCAKLAKIRVSIGCNPSAGSCSGDQHPILFEADATRTKKRRKLTRPPQVFGNTCLRPLGQFTLRHCHSHSKHQDSRLSAGSELLPHRGSFVLIHTHRSPVRWNLKLLPIPIYHIPINNSTYLI